MTGCSSCRDKSFEQPGFSFTMAFQPIVDVRDGSVFAHEALVRGADGAGAAVVLARVTDENRYAFDQACRVRAIELARRLGVTERLSVNFMPGAVYQPAHCLRATLSAARKHDFPVDRIMFEAPAGTNDADRGKIAEIIREYKKQGLLTAIDDFGAGRSERRLPAGVQPDVVKPAMELTRGIDRDPPRRAVVAEMLRAAQAAGVAVVAKGVETEAEFRTLADMGVSLFQGRLFAPPAFEATATPVFPAAAGPAASPPYPTIPLMSARS